MTKDKAIHAFFSAAIPGVTAYPASSVPEDADLPYLTYETASGAFGEGEYAIGVNLWFQTESEAIPNGAAQTLSAHIGYGGKTIPCDGGYIWIKRGSPFMRAIPEPNYRLKRRFINLTAEDLTAN